MLEEKYAKANFAAIDAQSDAPLEEAVALLVREKLTGEKPPESAGQVLDLWRDFIEQKAGPDMFEWQWIWTNFGSLATGR